MDADDTIAPNLNPEMARVYGNYLETCRRLGIEPVLTRSRAGIDVGMVGEARGPRGSADDALALRDDRECDAT